MKKINIQLLVCGAIFMTGCSMATTKETADVALISHEVKWSLDQLIQEAHARIDNYQGTEISKPEMRLMLEQLLAHPFTLSIFTGKGLDGEATRLIIGGMPGETNSIVRWICDKAPAVLATRERFGIFRTKLQALLHNDAELASVPCGVMDVLLGLDLQSVRNVRFTGIDLDARSLELARKNAITKGLDGISSFHKSDAWQLSAFAGRFDVITSNGLNIYEADDARVTALYQEFFKVLKPGGTLVTSFLTPPLALGGTTWKNVNMLDAAKQRILFGTIIGVNWQNFRTEQTTRAQLEAAGFVNVEITYDTQGMFPTVIAKKPLNN